MDEKNDILLEMIKSAKTKYSGDNLVLAIPRIFSKSFTSYCSIREDLLMIKKYLEKLEIEKDIIITSALTYSLISMYGKCFTDATQSKSPKLEPEKIFEENSNHLNTHNFLIDLRHNFIAHRGDTQNEVEAAYLLIPKQQGDPHVKYEQRKRMNLDIEKRKETLLLVDYLLPKVEEKIQKAGQKAYSSLLKHFTPKELSIMLLNNAREDE